MTAPKHTADGDKVVRLLHQWIAVRVDEKGIAWIDKQRSELGNGAPEWKFFTSFSAVPRFVGKSDLDLSPSDLEAADDARPGWDPSRWSVDQAGRTLLVLSLRHTEPAPFNAMLDAVFSTADVGESVALYQSLPVLPYPDRLTDRAAEGVRSNITSVFNAIALDSPYPLEYLEEAAWNQMVLKAVFVGSPLHRIKGLDARANPELARMLVDYAHERWAASRPVAPELWRPVGPFIDGNFVDDVARALESDRESDREAAALALHHAGSESARKVLKKSPDLQRRVESGELTWESFGGSGNRENG